MKKLSIIFSAVLILLVCTTTVKAQKENKSAENSPVFIAHYWVDTPQLIGCDEAIYFNVRMHVVIKRFKGVQTVFFNSHGEGVDSEGGVWTY